MTVRRLVIDILIPHTPSEIDYVERVSELEGVEGATLHVMEVDEQTKTAEMTIEGESILFNDVKTIIEELGGAIHSIDLVSSGSKMVKSKALNGSKE